MNLTVDGMISWESENSCTLDLDEEIKRWQNQLHEITTRNCNMMIGSLRCVKKEARELPTYDGLSALHEFLSKFENAVLNQQQFNALKWALCTTPARWWGMHQRLVWMQKDDVPTFWKTLTSNEIQSTGVEQLVRPPFPMGTGICCTIHTSAQPRESKQMTMIGRTTRITNSP